VPSQDRGLGAGARHALLHLKKDPRAAAVTCFAVPTLHTARFVWSRRAQNIVHYAQSANLHFAPLIMSDVRYAGLLRALAIVEYAAFATEKCAVTALRKRDS